MNKPNFYILTGGPGAGKTSVLDALAKRGYQTVAEVGRTIIQEQKAIGGNATHTGDQAAFAQLMLTPPSRISSNMSMTMMWCFSIAAYPNF